LANRLEGRLSTEVDRIRAEVQSRCAEARRRLAAAVKDLLLEVALADADAFLVAAASSAQRSMFGSAVGMLDNWATSLAMVPGYRKPRGIHEDYSAPRPASPAY
jgi:hypothetical protein